MSKSEEKKNLEHHGSEEIKVQSYHSEKDLKSRDKRAKKGKKSTKILKIVFKIFVLSFFAVISAGLALSFAIYYKYSAEFEKIKPQSNSTQLVFYDKDGKEIFEDFGSSEPNRVKLDEVPDEIKKATLAAEDLDFYKHGAIDLKGIGRAAYFNLRDSDKSGIYKLTDLLDESSYSQGGGSTITQQLVKNIYLTPEKSFSRKIKEIIFSYKLESKYSKDQILEMYLNEIYYGSQALGIKNAAKIYFNKDLDELDLAESSMLAGLPQAPTYYSPLGENFEASKKRQEYVLQQMYLANEISLDEAKEAANKDLTFYGKSETLNLYPYFSQYVKEELQTMLDAEQIEKGGIKVYTTLDSSKQELAQKVIKDQLVKLASRGASNAAVVMADPKTSEILAMVGGEDWNKSKVNVATSLRQPGSSFKPIVYATGLENGYTAATILADKYVNFGGNPPYTPKNYDLKYHGNITLRNALAQSLNIPAVEMAKLVGLDKVVNTAHALGISSLNETPSSYGLPLALGSGEVKLVDMVGAFSTFANGGKRMPQTSISKIVNAKGEEIPLKKRKSNQVISAEAAYIISSILSDNNARSGTFGSNSPLKTDKVTAVKTGTTENYSDSWTVGFSPSLAVGVWMGNNDHTPMKKVSGVEGAAYIWHDIITETLKNADNETFAKPVNIKEAWIAPSTGALAKAKSRPNILEYFKPGTEPKDKVDLSYLKQF